jgi:hypothetical protein
MLDDAQQTRWPVMIQGLVQHYTALWHESDTGLPWLGPSYTSGAQRSNERHLDHFLAIVSAELKSAPQTGSQQAMWARIGLAFRNVARTALDADERALETLLGGGFLEATTEFVQMARGFDPAITSKDIYLGCATGRVPSRAYSQRRPARPVPPAGHCSGRSGCRARSARQCGRACRCRTAARCSVGSARPRSQSRRRGPAQVSW